ncbi:ATP-binding protein [Acetobacteraceae bacterium KSS8]|uniref:ATP-binding protein n=1 Tax=Endosaccharibacter trunci TaxID=2812733 RepID=A0ABT1W6B7_9PROT|nr:ATP-binding protein [Acetobacteraceae bacterium KSS8]
MSLTRLQIGDEAFLVSSLIERCPRVMMLRELVRNALEAAETAPEGARTVWIDSVPVNGVPKLRIRNSGRGMDAAELFAMADLAASIRKTQALDGNFGMGAKVASLPSNRLGLRYRSCREGVVRAMLLGWREGVYGRIRQTGVDGQGAEVVETGRDSGADWTEVVLFGNAPDQDTSLDPFAGDPPMPAGWLWDELSARFFRIENGVDLFVREDRFEPLASRLPRLAARFDTVTLPDGVLLHYAHCPPGRFDMPPAMAGLIHRGELYDVRRDSDWLHVAPVFGVPFQAGSVVMLVELPDRHPVVPDAYRQFLRGADGLQDRIELRDFAPLLHAHRPDWLRALIEAGAPDAAVSDSTYQALKDLLRQLGVTRKPRLVRDDRPPVPEQRRDDTEHEEDGCAEAGPQPEAFDAELVPEMLLLRMPDDIAARALSGRAARYYPETHQLFLNALYPAAIDMREALERAFAWHGDPGRVRALAQRQAEQAMVARVGRVLVFALSKAGHWPDADLAQALSPHSLSLSADDWRPGLIEAQHAIRDALDGASAAPDRAGQRETVC